MPADPSRVVLVGPGVGAALLGLAVVTVLALVGLLALIRRRWRAVVFALGLFVCAGFGFTWLRRYTVGGVFGLGGSSYWVSRAARELSDLIAAEYLRVPLSATQYGVNLVQNAVNALPDPHVRLRLFEALVRLAPNDNWVRIYTLDVERQRELLGLTAGPPNNALQRTRRQSPPAPSSSPLSLISLGRRGSRQSEPSSGWTPIVTEMQV